MFPTAFSNIPSYGLLSLIGIFTAYFVFRHSMRKNGFIQNDILWFTFLLILLGLGGGRIFHFLTIGGSGYVFYGAFFGVLLAMFLFAFIKKVPFLLISDLLVGPIALSHIFGRLGCFAAGCCYGRPTDAFWGVTFTHPHSIAPLNISLVPTQILSSVANFILLVVLIWMARKNPPRGLLTAIYFMGYGSFRFIIEVLRWDERGNFILGLSPSQYISIVGISIGFFLFFNVRRNIRA